MNKIANEIVINIPISWTASEAKCVPNQPNEKIYKYSPGQILQVVPDLGPDDEYVEMTVPESRAKGMCKANFAAENTAEAMRASQAKLKATGDKYTAAKAKLKEMDDE